MSLHLNPSMDSNTRCQVGKTHHRKADEPGEANFTEAMNDVQRGEEAKKGRGLIEVSLRDPWGTDHPLRQECDQFLKIFADTYQEVLAELGLTPESGDYRSIVMSKKDMDNIAKRMIEKLNADPEAKELMVMLNVDFSADLEGGAHADRRKPDAKHHQAVLDEATRIIFEEWRKSSREADRLSDFISVTGQPPKNQVANRNQRNFTERPFENDVREHHRKFGRLTH